MTLPPGKHLRSIDRDLGGLPMLHTHASVSPIVEAWTTYRTSNATQWTAGQLARAKNADPLRGTRVSVVIPARNDLPHCEGSWPIA